MTGRKVCPCIDCGADVDVHKKHPLSKVRCPPHREAYFDSRKEHRRQKQKEAEQRYRARLKKEGRRRSSTSYDCTCEVCGKDFKGRRPETKLCSSECVLDHTRQKLDGKTVLRKCVGCHVELEVPWSVAIDRIRCVDCRETHRILMKARHRLTRKNYKTIELGEAPYEDYVVVGPVWSSQTESYGWRITARHKSNSNKREMSLAHYNLSVKLGRRVMDREGVVFLDGDIDNCTPENIALSTEKKKEVA